MSINKRSILSGMLGATASSIGKLALAPDSPVPSAAGSFCAAHVDRIGGDLAWACPYVSLATRGVCLLCMVGVNAVMISSFLEGMGESGRSWALRCRRRRISRAR